MPQSTISNIFNRDSDIKYSILESILTQFEFISSEWLLRGEGSMFRSNSKVDKTNYEKLLEEYTKQTEDLLSERDDEIRRLQLDNAILRAKEKVKNAG